MKSPESWTHAQLVISPTDRPADNSNHCTSSPRHRARRCRIDESRPSTRESITCRAALRLTVRLNDDAELRPPARPARPRCQLFLRLYNNRGWLGSRVVSVLDSGAVRPGFKSQPQRCRVTVLGKLFTPIVPLFTNQQNR